jgi:rubrerythrin
MKLIKSRKKLIDSLKDLRAVEISARDGYQDDSNSFRNIEIVETVKKIKIEEDKHIKLIEELIKILTK